MLFLFCFIEKVFVPWSDLKTPTNPRPDQIGTDSSEKTERKMPNAVVVPSVSVANNFTFLKEVLFQAASF